MWKVSHLMTVMRPCTAAGKEPKVILWACSCEAALSIVKWNSFQSKAFANVPSIRQAPHLPSANRTATFEHKQKVVTHVPVIWVKLRFHTDGTVQYVCTCQVMCFKLWQLYPECLGLRSSYPTSAEVSDSKDLFEPWGDKSVHCEYANV